MNKDFIRISSCLENKEYAYFFIMQGDQNFRFWHLLYSKQTKAYRFFCMNREDIHYKGLGRAKWLSEDNRLFFTSESNSLIQIGLNNTLFAHACSIGRDYCITTLKIKQF